MNSKIQNFLKQYFEENGYELLHWGYFTPEPEYKDIEHGCCFCCSGNLQGQTPFYIEALTKNNSNNYYIKKICIYEDSDYNDETYLEFSHNTYKDGNHPYTNYKQYMKGNPKNKYYLFLRNNNFFKK